MIKPTDIFTKITTQKCANPAKIYLEESHIKVEAKITFANILAKDRRSICPGEIIALNTDKPDDFRAKIKKC